MQTKKEKCKCIGPIFEDQFMGVLRVQYIASSRKNKFSSLKKKKKKKKKMKISQAGTI